MIYSKIVICQLIAQVGYALLFVTRLLLFMFMNMFLLEDNCISLEHGC